MSVTNCYQPAVRFYYSFQTRRSRSQTGRSTTPISIRHRSSQHLDTDSTYSSGMPLHDLPSVTTDFLEYDQFDDLDDLATK